MSFGSKIVVVLAGLSLAGCMQTTATFEKAPEASLKPRDKEFLAKASYDKVAVPDLTPRHQKLSPQGDPGSSWSIPTNNTSITSENGQALPTASPWARGAAFLRHRPRRQHAGLAEGPTADIHKRNRGRRSPFRAAPTTRSAPARSTSIRATATPCSASTAPTSRNTSAPRSPRAASA